MGPGRPGPRRSGQRPFSLKPVREALGDLVVGTAPESASLQERTNQFAQNTVKGTLVSGQVGTTETVTGQVAEFVGGIVGGPLGGVALGELVEKGGESEVLGGALGFIGLDDLDGDGKTTLTDAERFVRNLFAKADSGPSFEL